MKYSKCLNETGFFSKRPPEYCCVHHVFFGHGVRAISEREGMKVYLAPEYHSADYPNGVHRNKRNDLQVKKYAQAIFEETHTRQEFRDTFKCKSYL